MIGDITHAHSFFVREKKNEHFAEKMICDKKEKKKKQLL